MFKLRFSMPSLSILLAFFMVTSPLLAVFNNIHFQGRLTDRRGSPIPGVSQVKFTLYDAMAAGAVIWNGAAHEVTANEAGLFSTEVGPFNDLEIFNAGQDLFLEVEVAPVGSADFTALSPRQKLSGVPFSFHAGQAAVAASASSIVENSIGSHHIIDGEVNSVDLAPAAVDTLHIKDGAVTTLQLSTNSVGSLQIQDASIQYVDLATGAVRSSNMQDRSIAAEKMMLDSLTTREIHNGTLLSEDLGTESVKEINLATASVNSGKIQDGSIEGKDMQADTVESLQIKDGTLQGEDIAGGTISRDNINTVSFEASGTGLVPQGAIFMFLDSCPAGYSEVTALRNRLPVGADIANTHGVVPNTANKNMDAPHTHSLSHSHGISIPNTWENQESKNIVGQGTFNFSRPKLLFKVAMALPTSSNGALFETYDHRHTIAGPVPNVSGDSTAFPPSLTVLFCQKD